MANQVKDRKALLILLLVCGSLLLGCQGLAPGYKGSKISEGYRIPLVDGSKVVDYYRTPDLTLDYQYRKDQNQMKLSGQVQFASRIQMNFTTVRYFHLSVIFADAQGNVLQNRGLLTTSYEDPDDPLRFASNVALPPGATYMAFYYTGEARAGGGSGRDDDGGVDMTFWEYPLER
jgi:hypothetical protein